MTKTILHPPAWKSYRPAIGSQGHYSLDAPHRPVIINPMTCIVGLVHENCVYVGGDSAGVDDSHRLSVRADAKVFENGPMVMGFTTSFRMGQLLRWSLRVPTRPKSMPAEKFMSILFVDAVRKCLKKGGFAETKDGCEKGGAFLVGYQGGLFQVEEDFQVGMNADGFAAIGSGGQVALGSLYSTRQLGPEARVRLALEAAERFNAGVRGPFVVRSVGQGTELSKHDPKTWQALFRRHGFPGVVVRDSNHGDERLRVFSVFNIPDDKPKEFMEFVLDKIHGVAPKGWTDGVSFMLFSASSTRKHHPEILKEKK